MSKRSHSNDNNDSLRVMSHSKLQEVNRQCKARTEESVFVISPKESKNIGARRIRAEHSTEIVKSSIESLPANEVDVESEIKDNCCSESYLKGIHVICDSVSSNISIKKSIKEDLSDDQKFVPLEESVPKRKKPSAGTALSSKIEDMSAVFRGTRRFAEQCKKYVGAHISVAGGIHHAFNNTLMIAGQAFALFLKSQRKWDNPALSEDQIRLFDKACSQLAFDKSKILPHGSYLMNLGNPNKEKREKSEECLIDDLQRCERLGIKYYNFHPGSSVGECSRETSIQHIAQAINHGHRKTKNVVLVLENMAGQGNVIGAQFCDLAEIIDLVEDKSRVGICLDTCHLFGAGYDVRTATAFRQTMAEFENIVGIQYLRGVHLNDSMAPCGSKRDRHENIGKGLIGLDAFRYIMNDDRFSNIPMVLETPIHEDDIAVYAKEIYLLYSLVNVLPGQKTLAEYIEYEREQPMNCIKREA